MTESFLPSRRTVIATTLAAGFSGAVIPRAAPAQTLAQARALVDQAVADINAVIASGRSEAAMIRDFERILVRYADMPIIARSVLGPPARSASSAQINAFTQAFQGYMARKYGRRFREFIGGTITVIGGRPVRSFFEVTSTVTLRGEAPFELRWLVSSASGQNKFFNLIIEGVNLMISERNEIAALLDRNNGNIDAMIADLRNFG